MSDVDWKRENSRWFRKLLFAVDIQAMFGVSDEEAEKYGEEQVNIPGRKSLGETLIERGNFELYNASTGHVLYRGGTK